MQELKHILFEEEKLPYDLQMLTPYKKLCITSYSKDKIRQKKKTPVHFLKHFLIMEAGYPVTNNLPATSTWYLGDLLNHQHQGDQGDQVDPKRTKWWEKKGWDQKDSYIR